MNFQNQEDTICALSSPAGKGAISLIRLSGGHALQIVNSVFSGDILQAASHTAHFGRIYRNNEILDEVLLTVFRGPASFTGEDTVEIACHGSVYIQQQLLELLLEKGARLAGPGEFSLRAYLNGKMDLSQTEAIADLISAGSKAAHRLAMQQMRGGFSKELQELRQSLLDFASLVELELDFSEEDVEFADRTQLVKLVNEIKRKVNSLENSFQLGNVIKNGVPVAIVGAPNAGKSTLLNALLKEEKAIVSDIAGTTRDVIEDTIVLTGIEFRFIDTAGIRETKDSIENMGIERAYKQISNAQIVLLLIDLSETDEKTALEQIAKFRERSIRKEQTFLPLFNKTDRINRADFERLSTEGLFISAKGQINLDRLIERLLQAVHLDESENELIVTNVRHYEILKKCTLSLGKIEEGLNAQLPGDLLALDIRETLDLLGQITGNVSNDELLGNIFANFCIGK